MASNQNAAASSTQVANPTRLDRQLALFWCASLALVAVLAFSGSIDGELVWDDDAVVTASAQRSIRAVLTSDLFGNVDRGLSTANYYRPLDALAFHVLRRLAPQPTWPLHAFGLLCHGLASVLVFVTLRRWLARRASGAETSARLVGWCCWLVSCGWAVLPLKAENVAWISGVGDALGFACLLGALWLASRQTSRASRIALTVLGTLLALASKESFVVAPIFVGVEVWIREASRAPTSFETMPGQRSLWRASNASNALVLWASAGCAATYLCFRALAFPLHGGGGAMFAGLSPSSRTALVLESLGHALRALALPIFPSLYRGPIGFESPRVLLPDHPALALGVLGALAVGFLVVRYAGARLPASLVLGSLLPYLNLVPAGLECRMSDRYLYVPSFGLALAVASALLALGPSLRRFASIALGGATLVLVPLAFLRSLDFRSSQALWLGEVRDGNRAISVLENAAGVAEREEHHEDARDLRLLAARRYGELGFAEGFADRVAALRAQVAATGPADPGSFRGYQRLLEQLLDEVPGALSVPLPERPTLVFQPASPQARRYAVLHASSTRLELALLLARNGDARADVWLDAGLAACPECPAARLLASRVRLAQRDPRRAEQSISSPTVAAPALTEAIDLQRAILAGDSAKARVLAAVLGESYPVACRELGAAPAPLLAPDTSRLICLAAGQGQAASAQETAAVSELIQSAAERSRWVLAQSRLGAP